jgi:hypothetical protein
LCLVVKEVPAGLKSEEVIKHFSRYGFRVECFIQFLQNHNQIFVRTAKVYCPSRIAKSILADTAHSVNGHYFELEDPAKSDWSDRPFKLQATHSLQKLSKRDAKLYFSHLAMETGVDIKLEFPDPSSKWWGSHPLTIYLLNRDSVNTILQTRHIANSFTLEVFEAEERQEFYPSRQGSSNERHLQSGLDALLLTDNKSAAGLSSVGSQHCYNNQAPTASKVGNKMISSQRETFEPQIVRATTKPSPNANCTFIDSNTTTQCHQMDRSKFHPSSIMQTQAINDPDHYQYLSEEQQAPSFASRFSTMKSLKGTQRESTVADQEGSLSGYSASHGRSQFEAELLTPPQDGRGLLLCRPRPASLCNPLADLWSRGESECHIGSQRSLIKYQDDELDWPTEMSHHKFDRQPQTNSQSNNFNRNYTNSWSGPNPSSQSSEEGLFDETAVVERRVPQSAATVRQLNTGSKAQYRLEPRNPESTIPQRPSTFGSLGGSAGQGMSRTEILNLKLRDYELNLFPSAPSMADPLYFDPMDVAMHNGEKILTEGEVAEHFRKYATTRLMAVYGKRMLGERDETSRSEGQPTSSYPRASNNFPGTNISEPQENRQRFEYSLWGPVNPCILNKVLGVVAMSALKKLPSNATIDEKFEAISKSEEDFNRLPTLAELRELLKAKKTASVQQTATTVSQATIQPSKIAKSNTSVPEAETGSQACPLRVASRQITPILSGC